MTTNGPLTPDAVLHPAVEERRPELGVDLQPRQRRARRRPAHRRSTPASSSWPGWASCRADRPRRRPLARRRRRSDQAHHRQRRPASTATAPSAAGTEDGYGDCNVGDATACTVPGQAVGRGRAAPRARTRAPATCGRCCPPSGPSTRSPPATGRRAVDLGARMARTGSGVGLIPEQAWENPDLAASPFGTAAGVRVDRLRQRQGGRQRVAADLVGGARSCGCPRDLRAGRDHRAAGGHHRPLRRPHPGRHRR